MRWVMIAAAAVLAGCADGGNSDPQQLVDRATLAAQNMLNDRNGTDAQGVLRRARAVVICPRVFRAGFLLGGEGGACVLSARAGGGSWTAPAFYTLGGASVGFLIGIQDAEIMLIIMNDRGLTAVLDSQFKLGADATATFVELGGGIEGATTAALRADIVGFARTRGLYAGVSLNGSLLSVNSELNRAYYGRPVGGQQIVVGVEVSNPGADPLREVLSRYGAQSGQSGATQSGTIQSGAIQSGATQPRAAAPAYGGPGPAIPGRPAAPSYAPGPSGSGGYGAGSAPVQQQALPPPR